MLLVCFLVALAVSFACFGLSLKAPFFKDDFDFLGPASQGFYGARITNWADWFGFWNPLRGWFYRPVFLMWWAAGLSLFGASPVAFHAGSILLHAGVIFLFGWLVWRLTARELSAFLAALLFALWPLKDEAVTWIAANSTLLMAGFYLAAMHAWLSFRRTRQMRWVVWALVFSWLSLCSKSEAVSLPFAMAAMDVSTGSFQVRRAWPYLPLLCLTGLFIRLESMASHYYTLHRDPGAATLYSFTLAQKLYFYGEMLWQLSTGRGIRGDFTTPLLLAAVIGYSLVTGHRGINRVLLAGAVLWFLGAAAPVPLAAGDHATESRFFYLPSLPVSLVAAVLLLPLLRNTRGHLILAAWIAGLIATRISTLNDPAALWLVLAGFILVLPVGYVCRAVSPATVARAAALALAPQIAIYCGQSLYYLPALLIIAALPRRRVAWCLAALIAWNWDCRAAFVAGVFLTVLESRRFEAFYQRVTARMERNLEPEFAVAQ